MHPPIQPRAGRMAHNRQNPPRTGEARDLDWRQRNRPVNAALSHFRDYVVSGKEACFKPGAEIYELACRRGGFRPAEAVFIDDSLKNVEGARAIGLSAIHHRSAEETVAALRTLGLPA